MSEREAGRPRDPRVDAAVLAAARALVCEIGYAETTVDRIARRAGVSRTAIYRRWPSKALIVHEAVFPPGEAQLHMASSGDLGSDLKAMVAGAVSLFSRPEIRAAFPGLMADAMADERVRNAFRQGLEATARQELEEILRQAAERGEARAGISADTLIHVVAGSFLFRLVAWGPETLQELGDELTGLLVTALGVANA